jgi:uncharacterized protein YbaR (Trm112 family)
MRLHKICPYCKGKLDCTDTNEQGMDIYECMRDNRIFVIPTGTGQKYIDGLTKPAAHKDTIDGTLFAAVCDAHIAHKDELDAQQMFYFLRGVLYQWCVDHNADVMDMEEMFIGDIRFMSTPFAGHTSNCMCNACTIQRAGNKFTAPTLL